MKSLRAMISQSPITMFLAIITILALGSILLVGCSLTVQDEVPGEITGRVFLDNDANSECDTCDCDFYLEDIVIRLYKGNCGGIVRQTTETDSEGVYIFADLQPGEYCVYPKVKTICEGYKPTTPIQQKVVVVSGEMVEAPWFGFDYNLDGNN